MNWKEVAKRFVIGLVAIVLLTSIGMVVWSLKSTYPARDVAQSYLQSSETVTVSTTTWITLTPEDATTPGLIFYPGGLVEPAAYTPILHQLAAEGILIVIPPMPLNLAFFNTGAADAIISAYPDIQHWFIAGHSLGGVAASIYAEGHAEELDGLILWDSYPPGSSDLSTTSLHTLSIYSMTDQVPNTPNFNDKRDLLPSNTEFIGIEGASHAQFGDYGPQKGDVVPSISLEQQHEQVLTLMLHFILP